MESSSFSSLARVRILLLPIGPIKRSTFDKWAALIRSFEHIRLGDIPPDSREEKSRFIPSPLSTGFLHLSFPSHPPPIYHGPLSLFRISSCPLGVIGIADATETTSLAFISAEYNTAIATYFPSTSAFPFAGKCYAFEDGDGNANINNSSGTFPEIVTIPSVMGNKKLYIGTLLADLCHDILAEFPSLVRALDSPGGLESLHSNLFPSIKLGSADQPPPNVVDPNTLDPTRPYSQAMEGVASTSTVHIRRTSTAVVTSTNVQPMLAVTGTAKKRASTINTGASSGKLCKIIADLYLLSGKLVDAHYWYGESVSLLKSPQDTVWLASAYEGFSTIEVLDAWQVIETMSETLESIIKDPWADISERLGQSTMLYAKSAPAYHPPSASHSADSEYASLTLIYTSAVLRHSQLLLSIWQAKGWNPRALRTLVQMSSILDVSPSLSADLFEMSSLTSITRSQIATVASQAHGPFLMHLQPHDRIRVLESLASIYGCLGFKRKQVYVLREVVAAIMDLIVCAREEAQSAGKEVMSGGVPGGGGGADPTLLKVMDLEKGMVGVRESENVAGNDSMLRLVRYVCDVYGVDLGAVKVLSGDSNTLELKATRERADEEAEEVEAETAEDGKEHTYGWPDLQVGAVREAVAVAEALPDYPAVAQFALSTLKQLHAYLTPSEQQHLFATSSRVLSIARRRGDDRQLEYWSGRPVISIEISPPSLLRVVVERPIRDLMPRSSEMTKVTRLGPFIYDPRLKSSTTQTVAVQNEPLEFVLTLRNSFAFDFDIPSLTVSTSGVPIQVDPIGVLVPASSFHVVRISGTPLGSGTLVVRGCVAKLADGIPREFILPLSTEEEEGRLAKRQSVWESEDVKVKRSGLSARAVERAKEKNRMSTTVVAKKEVLKFLECKVVPEQPLLRVKRSSLMHGAVMLYAGEISTIRFTLENISTIPVDFVKFTFDDSTILPAQTALAEGELSVAEAYETEYDLVHRPVFSRVPPVSEQLDIGPGKQVIVDVSCLGKPRCTSGVVQISYSYARRHLPTAPDVFYTRQILYPILVTVYHALECHDMDIIPFQKIDAPLQSDGDDERVRRALLDVNDEGDWCLFSVDVRNVYGLPFEVTFERKQEGVPQALATRLIAPGATSRVLLPLRRVSLPPSVTSQPIPMLSDRQFVVSKSHLSSAEESIQRELFWYREELFKCVRGRWKEPGSTRTGELSLRTQRFSMPMLKSLRVPRFKAEFSLEGQDGHVSSISSNGKLIARPNEFSYLRARISNLSDQPCTLSLTYDLIPPTPGEHVVVEGSLHQIPIGLVAAGEVVEEDLTLCFVAEGVFEFRANVSVFGTEEGVATDVCVLVKE
ncbi:hypothetical protein BOTBODRAFT_139417 [Botryobasidium botryosum FD-172 SS1]|uniref:Uncharacterized protein n=1 Tax=Botryobasidium botryosum (strain FD-172 SS1) TaxID=930990 RepID=A0A067M8L4_BOTB1|nr:hypothetical protein BOTBODRAFT_139417 [Botryobasidium botryosum FD-172 SS1]